jgi:hypothetical protein
MLCLLQVRGEVHHDRRLHQLMLQEERDMWLSKHRGLGGRCGPLDDEEEGGGARGQCLGDGSIGEWAADDAAKAGSWMCACLLVHCAHVCVAGGMESL